jgi:hypothetical protein
MMTSLAFIGYISFEESNLEKRDLSIEGLIEWP